MDIEERKKDAEEKSKVLEERAKALASLTDRQVAAIEGYFRFTIDPARYEDSVKPDGNIDYQYGFTRGSRKTAQTFIRAIKASKERVARKQKKTQSPS